MWPGFPGPDHGRPDIDTANNKESGKKRRNKKKESFVGRVTRRTRESASLASLLFNEPKAFPGALLDLIKRAFRVVWAARGGGLYACGFFVVFVWLEVRTFFGELFGADSVSGFVTEQLFEFVIRFTVQSIANTVEAFLWPVRVIQWNQPWGLVALGAAYLVFANFLKKPIEGWLFDGDPDAEEAEQK